MLSELLADLDACDSQKGDNKVLANGEFAPGESVTNFSICAIAVSRSMNDV